MNLIDTNIKPDPFDPQRGDVYESGGPFPQRIVVEDPPNYKDERIRYRVDGGADSNLTTLGQFHLHLAGLGEIRGVGRVREYSPVTPDEIRQLVHQLRSTAIGVDDVTGNLMRGAAATIAEQTAKLEEMHKRFSAHERALVTLGFHPGEDPEQWASRVHYEIVSNRKHDDQGCAGELLVNTAWRLSTLIDAVVGPGTKDPRSDADLIRIATNARQVSDQVRSAVRLLGFEWDDSKADAGHALIEAVRAERKVASDLALELDSISAFIAPHGVVMPAGSTNPTSLELVRWLVVTGGVVPHVCHPTLTEVQEAQGVELKARWDRYASVAQAPRQAPAYCSGFVTILAVKDRQIVQRQSWTSDWPGFEPTDVSFHDDDPRFAAADALAFGDCQGTWTWQGRCYFADKQQWQGEWTEEKE